MSNYRTVTPSPVFGIRPGFNVSDLPSYATTQEAVVFTNITTAQVSTAFSVGARYLEVNVTLASSTTTCNIDLYTSVNGTDTLVSSQPVEFLCSTVQFGNFEGVNLDGVPFKIGVSNIQNTGNISVSYKVNG
jgi:hypothetical protein